MTRLLDWRLDGPDPEGKVWLFKPGPPAEGVMLGDYEAVAEAFAAWLEQNDFGERAVERK